jgi:carboxylesterase
MVKNILKTVRGTLFKDPRKLYQEEVEFLNQPFYFEGTNGKAVLLVHGWTSTPYEVRRLGKFLNENGYTVSGPMLTGHGTVPKNLENIHWNQWLEDIEKAYRELKEKFPKVYIGGTSIGSNLAIMLASRHPEISGIILLATPYKIRWEKLAVFSAKIIGKIKNYNRKFYPPTFGVSTTITRLISYQTYPIKSALETFELVRVSRKYLSKITQPCLIIQSASDHVIWKKSLEEIYKRIKSKIKKKISIKRAYHTFISDIKNVKIFEEILEFLERN